MKLNDLYDYGLKIYQDDDNFKFSLDSILLAESVVVHKNDKILDLCTGNAPLPMILSTKCNNQIFGFEIQSEVFKTAQASVKYNNLEKQIILYNDDIKNCQNYFPGNNFEIITCNPPYFKLVEDSYINEDYSKAVSRHEILIDLENIIFISSRLLKSHCSFYIVYRYERIQELFECLSRHKLFVKNLYIINTKDEPDIFIVRAVKDGKYGCKCKIINIERNKSYKNIFKEGE